MYTPQTPTIKPSPHIPPVKRIETQEASIWRKFISKWLAFSGPEVSRYSESIEDQEKLRRAHLLSALFPLILVAILISLPTALTRPIYWFPLLLIALLGGVSLLFNRQGRINWSGTSFIFAIDLTLTTIMATQPHGIRNGNIPDFDLFIASVLIAGIILPRKFLPFITILHIGIITAIFTLLPHDRLLTEEIMINQKGVAFAALSDAYLLQFVGMTIAWLSGWSVDRGLKRASKAEELIQARAYLDEQNRQMREQRERLEYGISVLKDVQSQVANGQYSARARLQDNELIPLALSLNLMIERLSRVAKVEQEYNRLERAMRLIIELRNKVVYENELISYQPTGTLADQFYPLIERYHQVLLSAKHCAKQLEKTRSDLQGQTAPLGKMQSVLLQTQSLTKMQLQEYSPSANHLFESKTFPYAQSIKPQREGSWNERGFASDYKKPIEQEIELLNEALDLCAQIQEISTRCIQEARIS